MYLIQQLAQQWEDDQRFTFFSQRAFMMYWAASTVFLLSSSAFGFSLASMSLQLARKGQAKPFDMNRQLPKMHPRGDRSISQMLWMRWYLLSSCLMASWNSHTASFILIFSTTSIVCGFDSLLSSSRIWYPRRWHILSHASIALARSSTSLNMILPLTRSLIVQVVSVWLLERSSRMRVISLVQTSIISWTMVTRVISLSPFLRAVSILEIILCTLASSISFLNIFSRMRRITLNCFEASLGSFMFTPYGIPLERLRTASTKSMNSGNACSASLLTLSISLQRISQLPKQAVSLKRLTLHSLDGVKYFNLKLRLQALSV